MQSAQLRPAFSSAVEQLGFGSVSGCFSCNGKTFVGGSARVFVPVEKCSDAKPMMAVWEVASAGKRFDHVECGTG